MLKVLYMIIVPFWILFLIVWRLFTLLLMIISLPVLFFFPQEIMQNFDQIVNKAALKFLKIIWRVLKTCFFILLTIVLIPLTPVLMIWAPLGGTLWAWTIERGKPIRLETKVRVYNNLFKFGVCLMILFWMLGIFIGFFAGPLGYIIGGVVGFILWIFPTMDCSNLADKAKAELDAVEGKIENELTSANHPYYFADSCSSQKVVFTVSSSAPPPECVKNSDSASQTLSSSESDCCGNDSQSRPAT